MARSAATSCAGGSRSSMVFAGRAEQDESCTSSKSLTNGVEGWRRGRMAFATCLACNVPDGRWPMVAPGGGVGRYAPAVIDPKSGGE
eukprot:4387721-Prymnesium_polylepis.1